MQIKGKQVSYKRFIKDTHTHTHTLWLLRDKTTLSHCKNKAVIVGSRKGENEDSTRCKIHITWSAHTQKHTQAAGQSQAKSETVETAAPKQQRQPRCSELGWQRRRGSVCGLHVQARKSLCACVVQGLDRGQKGRRSLKTPPHSAAFVNIQWRIRSKRACVTFIRGSITLTSWDMRM